MFPCKIAFVLGKPSFSTKGVVRIAKWHGWILHRKVQPYLAAPGCTGPGNDCKLWHAESFSLTTWTLHFDLNAFFSRPSEEFLSFLFGLLLRHVLLIFCTGNLFPYHFRCCGNQASLLGDFLVPCVPGDHFENLEARLVLWNLNRWESSMSK